MTERVEGGVSWTQTFNPENRLASVSDGTDTWTFVYDGDGNRVKQVNPDGTINLLLGGGLYTVVDAVGLLGNPEVTKYYSIAGQRIAMRKDTDPLQYLLTDHLGSIAAVLDAEGSLVSEQRYLPFGTERLAPDIAQTDFGFTGQRDLAAVGLMDYNARFYDASVGRWTQPDSIVPSPGNPQSLNRYSYVHNNPLVYIDPSGNFACSHSIILDDQIVCLPLYPTKPISPTQLGNIAPKSTPPPPTSPILDDLSASINEAVVTPNPALPWTLNSCLNTWNAACEISGSSFYQWESLYGYTGSLVPLADLAVKAGVLSAAIASVYLLNPLPITYAIGFDSLWSASLPLMDPDKFANYYAEYQAVNPSDPGSVMASWSWNVALDISEISEGFSYLGVSGLNLILTPQPVPSPP